VTPELPPNALRRSLSLPLIVLYGLGTTVGAGIYALTGKVAGVAGMHAPLSFLGAALLAGFTAFSFAELSARLPYSAGEARFVSVAFGWHRLALVVGLLVALSGAISSATIINAFHGYLDDLLPVPRTPVIVATVLVLVALACWGIRESVSVAAVMTVVEIGGLVLIIVSAGGSFADLPDRLGELAPPPPGALWNGILFGAVLAFYAFIGFEDIVNVAEEVSGAAHIVPLAIVLTLVITTLLYVAIAFVSVLSVPTDRLAESGAPLVLVYTSGGAGISGLINLIALIAVINGALIQTIMGARVLYGLAQMQELPSIFGYVHPRTRTPVVATAAIGAVMLVFALALPLIRLAELTAMLVLVVFVLCNVALIRIKLRDPLPPGVRAVPLWVPVMGALTSAGILSYALVRPLLS
jgi:basic amino acid/polyamine antiporter, APA family